MYGITSYIGIFLSLFLLPLIVNLFLFESITIYKNKVILNRYIFGEKYLNIENIKCVKSNSSGLFEIPMFEEKQNPLTKFYFFVSALPHKEAIELVETVSDLLNKKKGKLR